MRSRSTPRFQFDLAEHGADAQERAAAQARGELLTPIVKGWCTEIGNEVAALGVQVHGGMGFIEETGAAQYVRDVRITTIYEGTTGIQSNDLIGRKLGRDRGAAMVALIADMQRELQTPGGGCGGRGHSPGRPRGGRFARRRHAGAAADCSPPVPMWVWRCRCRT